MFDVRLSQGKIEHPTFFLKKDPNGQKTKIFGFLTIRANIHTCFFPLTNVNKTSLSIFYFTLKVITCWMLPISTVPPMSGCIMLRLESQLQTFQEQATVTGPLHPSDEINTQGNNRY